MICGLFRTASILPLDKGESLLRALHSRRDAANPGIALQALCCGPESHLLSSTRGNTNDAATESEQAAGLARKASQRGA